MAAGWPCPTAAPHTPARTTAAETLAIRMIFSVFHRPALTPSICLLRQPKAAPGRPDVEPPKAIDLKKDRGLTLQWADGSSSYYSIPYLRKMSPSAEMRGLREEMARNPLTVLPANFGNARGPLTATGAELVGNYAIKITFSDGHDAGIYSWDYLRSIDPADQPPPLSKPLPGP